MDSEIMDTLDRLSSHCHTHTALHGQPTQVNVPLNWSQNTVYVNTVDLTTNEAQSSNKHFP